MTTNVKIEDLTGQKELLDGITLDLEKDTLPVNLIRGASGTGKSWLLNAICEKWQEHRRPILRLTSDAQYVHRELYPFNSAISKQTTGLSRARIVKDAFSKVASAIPIAGGFLEFVATQSLNSREAHQKSTSLFLTDAEREVLFHLQRIAGADPLLILCDNLQCFDLASIQLLCTLHDPDIAETYPFAKEVRMVCAITDGASIEDSMRVAIKSLNIRECRIEYVSHESIGRILQELGVTFTLPHDVLQYCAEVSGGHLEVLRLIATYIGKDSTRPKRLLAESEGPESLVEVLLLERVRSLGEEGVKILNLLELLAVAGFAFSASEMKCLLSEIHSPLKASVPQAIAIDLLREYEERISFSHEIVQRTFLRRMGENRPEVHEKFARCIGYLRPGDYSFRAFHYALAGKVNEANDMRFLASMQKLRAGELVLSTEIDEICTAVSSETAAFYRGLRDAWLLFRSGDVAMARKILEGLSEIHSDLLLAEKDYLFARCVKAQPSVNDRRLILELLRRWLILSPGEFEQWFRLLSMLIILEADHGNFVDARYTNRILGGELAKRIGFDPFAESARHILNRRTASIFSADIAAVKCRDAVDYFAGGQNANIPAPTRSPMQLYLARTNLSANLLMLGHFEDSIETARAALAMRKEFPEIEFPRPEIPLNNLTLAGYRCGLISTSEACDVLSRASAAAKKSDAILLRNNFGVMKALNGSLREAFDDLSEIKPDLPHDGYYSYFVTANLICIGYLANKITDSHKRWGELRDRLPEIPDTEKIALTKRHDLLSKAFERVQVGDVKSWWNYLVDNASPEVGPIWEFYGRGLLFSDIQFWSDA